MSQEPLVSVIIPAYNAAHLLGDTVRSVLEQTYSSVEIIIVNDGSRDQTLHVARLFEGPRVKVMDQENRGQSASANKGYRESRGEYIVYLDADDLISPNKIESQVGRLRKSGPDSVAFSPWGRFYANPADVKFVPEPFWRDIDPIDFHIEMWDRYSMIQGGCYLIPRKLIETSGGWDESLTLANDFPFFPRVLLQASNLLFCSDVALLYRSGVAGSLSGRRTSAAWHSSYRAAVSGTDFLLQRESGPRARRACSRVLEEFVYASFPKVPELRIEAMNRVKRMGGPHFHPQMGPRMRVASRVMGWKAATALRHAVRVLLGNS